MLIATILILKLQVFRLHPRDEFGIVPFSIIEKKKQGNSEKRSFGELALACLWKIKLTIIYFGVNYIKGVVLIGGAHEYKNDIVYLDN